MNLSGIQTALRVIPTGLLLCLLAGCTASWQAPLETREQSSRPAGTSARAGVSSPPKGKRTPIGPVAHYRVMRGDTLYAIAWRSNIDFRDLARWNGIHAPYTIYAGQQLRMRPPKQAATVATKSRSTAKPASRSPPPKQVSGPADKRDPSKSNPSGSKSSSHTRTPPGATAKVGQRGRLAWTWPANGKVVSSYKAGDRLRKGIKVSGNPGDAVRAAESGKVVYSGSGLIGYGQLIIVKHNDKYLSAYGHNRKLLVSQGQQVTKGQTIAELGQANDGQALLHFEIRRDGKPVNPVALLPGR